MTHKLGPDLKNAVRGYFKSREDGFKPKSKKECLEVISSAYQLQPGIVGFTAVAGSFWFEWEDGKVTYHNQSNWWRMKQVARVFDVAKKPNDNALSNTLSHAFRTVSQPIGG